MRPITVVLFESGVVGHLATTTSTLHVGPTVDVGLTFCGMHMRLVKEESLNRRRVAQRIRFELIPIPYIDVYLES